MKRLGSITGLVLATAAVVLVAGAAAPDAAEACSKQNVPAKRLSTVEVRQVIRCVINRKRDGIRNLKPSSKLKRAAQRHSRKMRNQSCFSHQCPGEPNLTRRVSRTGYLRGVRSYKLGEVIADLPPRRSPRKVVKAWMNSPPHRATLLGNFEHFNVGRATKNRKHAYYTVVFGRKNG